ncbi:DUF389 domain-containing protein [Micromonospora musae]|uniref:DUF389 domain-containing protein n=1 Tax=Micromonospora musae TaxID=1894970 RepID=UPI003433E3C4
MIPGAARQPAGDLILCDVVRESADHVLQGLQLLGVEATGGSAADDVGLSGTFLVLIIVATMIAGIGVLLDQPILVVGAMVAGPEFGPLAALCVGLLPPAGHHRQVAAGPAGGFLAAMVATAVSTWTPTAAGLVDRQMLLVERPLTDFIWRPDALSWVVGLLAGVAGMLSLTSKKSGSLVGVLISVTTVPAAANVAVAAAYGVWDEASGSALQLVIDLCAIVLAGLLTLAVQQLWWWWNLARRSRRPAAG